MSEVKVYKKRESIIYAGFKPEGAPDFYEVEYVLKSDYDDLKNKLAQYESGDLPTWKSEHDILKEVCDSLDKSNQELQKDLEVVRDSHRRQCQLNDALYLKQIQLENQNEELKLHIADRSEKYKIAMDKGVDVLSAEIKALKAKLEKAELEVKFVKEYLNPADTSFKQMIDAFRVLPKEKQDKLIKLSQSLVDFENT